MSKPQNYVPQRPSAPMQKSLRNQTPEERERLKEQEQRELEERDPNFGDPEAQEAARLAAEFAAANPTDATVAGGTSVLEDADALADRLEASEEFLAANRNLLLGVLGAVIAVVVGGFLFWQYRAGQDQEGQAAMFTAVNYFETDSLKQALNGDGQNPGLLKIADEYGSTKAGNLAHFYAGTALLKQGKFAEASEHLGKFSSDDLLLQARAYCLQGDAAMELGQKDKAAELYLKAATYKANPHFSPAYLLKAAGAQEAQNQFGEAVKTYDRLINDYPTSQEANDAKRYRARAAATAGVK
jgi:tetratricopeptide (TPR) repeat protein